MKLESIHRDARSKISQLLPEDALSKSRLLDVDESADFDLEEIIDELDIRISDQFSEETLTKIVLLEHFLYVKTGKELSTPEKVASCIELRNNLSQLLLPPSQFAENPPYSTVGKPIFTAKAIRQYHVLSYRGLLCLSHLQWLCPASEQDDVFSVMSCLAVFTHPRDLWTSKSSHEEAERLIRIVNSTLKEGEVEVLLARLLREQVKPAFEKTKNAKLTPQSRKIIDPLPTSRSGVEDNAASQPWKYKAVYIPTLLRWVLRHLEHVKRTFVEEHWPLMIPPILALIDDSSMKHKTAGCADLSLFLLCESSTILERTGLGEIFEEAVAPCLLYLPTLTEVSESVAILEQAYLALIRLTCVRFPDRENRSKKVKALDRVMRHGIIKGYAHAAEHVKIAQILVGQIGGLIDELGIDVAKHFEEILILLSGVLTNPWGTASTPLLRASLSALQRLLLVAWPRLGGHRGELLRALTIPWLRIEEDKESSEELRAIQRDIEKCAQIFAVALDKVADVITDYRVLTGSESRLERLLVQQAKE